MSEPAPAAPDGQSGQTGPTRTDLDGNPLFYCPLDLHWPRLLPETTRSQIHQLSPGARAAFCFNPRLHCQQDVPDMPAWHQRMQRVRFSDELPICWIPHPLLNYPEAYWPTPDMLELLQQLASGDKPLASLDDECFSLLSAAHVLVLDEEDYAEQRQALQAHWRARLSQEQYLHIPGLLSPLQIAALREYTRQMRHSAELSQQDDDYTRRNYKFLDQVLTFWHQHLLKIMTPLVDAQLRPSYNVISYYEDTHLNRHKDREPCIWNVSIQLDTDPPNAEGAPWPIWLETRHGPTAIPLQAGDALIYRGRDMEHWREALPPGRRETVLLFHFVDEHYQGPLY